jgi:hypothetical protein
MNKLIIHVQLLRSWVTFLLIFLFVFNSFGVIKNALLFIHVPKERHKLGLIDPFSGNEAAQVRV